jgi:hypothetical protein
MTVPQAQMCLQRCGSRIRPIRKGEHPRQHLEDFCGVLQALNGLDPALYLRELFGRIADHPINRISELLPWNLATSLVSILRSTWTRRDLSYAGQPLN